MYQVAQITDDASQSQSLALPDGSLINISMYYRPMQYGWFITTLSYNGFVLNGLRITHSPNMLNQWINILPFGLACTSLTADREPTQQQDFASGTFQIYVLTHDECVQYQTFLSSGVTIP